MAFNSKMTFVSGGDKDLFTKTPANVSATHWDDEPAAKGKKRRGSNASTPAAKKAKSGPSKAVAALLNQPKKTRKRGVKAATSRPIGRTFDECDEADKMLIEWNESGKNWAEIKAKWKDMTGEGAAGSTLPNRYARLKSNFVVVREEDIGPMLQAKRQVEQSFDAQKWELIASIVKKETGEDYHGVVLKRQYKKMMVSTGVVPPTGVQDNDFKIEELASSDSGVGHEDENQDEGDEEGEE